jgi:hypothetical protein
VISSPQKKEGTIRIFFQNVNSIYKFKSWETLKDTGKALNNLHIDIIGFAETNLKWTFRTINQARCILQQSCSLIQLTTSSSNEPTRTPFQPGGTMTIAKDKYTGRIIGTIKDESNMGRWSGYKFSTTLQHNLNILTVYQSVPSEGLHSTYKQQQSKLRDMGHSNPNPRTQLLQDLKEEILKWNSQGDKTIILIDANDNLYNKNSLLPTFLSQTNLTSLIPNPFNNPPTHSRGSKCIDYIFGSTSILQHVTSSGINAFYDLPYIHSDHRGLFVDINELALFGATLSTIIPPTPRKLISTSKGLVQKFLQNIENTKHIP